MKIKWNIETGYVNRIPDWKFEIPDEELEGLNESEIEAVIDDYVEDEFRNKIYLHWKKA